MSVTTDIFFKRAKFTSWSNNYKHVILPYGEPAIVKFDDNSMALKIGDGSSEFSSLNYIANSNVKLNIDYENNKILSFINLETNEELSLSLDTVQLKDLIVNGVGRFIGKVYASEFIGKLTGNADTATTATDADKLDGHHGSVAQSASTYVLRDSNGYINTSYINSNTPLNENPSISQVIVTNGNDHYYRKASLAHLKSSLGSMPANGGNSATVNGHTVNSDVPANAKFTDTDTWRPLGTTADTACAGNDSRLSNARPASDVYAWAKASTKPTYTASEVGAYTKSETDTKLNSKINTSLKGSANGLAELDSNGKVLSTQLPSFVDDVLEGYLSSGKFYKESAHTTQILGESGKIYIDLSTEKAYRWSGSAFVVISETLALGETSSTAYRGDRGKTAYDHSQSTHARIDATKVEKSSTNGNIKINGTETTVYTHPGGTNPHGTTKSDVGLGNVGNFKAVSTVSNQGLSDTEKSNARSNIGAQVAGSYASSTHNHDDKYQSKGSYASASHTHDDRYYTESEINTKLNDKANSSHTHTKSQITDFPTSLPASDVYAWAKASSKPSYSWSEITSKPSTFTPASHTHNYAGSNSTGGNALTLQLDRVGNDANWLPSSPSTTQMRELSSSSYNIPYSQWWQILANRSADISYGSQLAMGMTTNDLYFRNYQSGNWGSWRKVIFSDDTISMANYATSAGSAPANGGNSATVNGHTVNSDVPANAKFTDTNTWRPLGTTANTACAGNDARLSNSRPASDVYAWAKASSKPSYTKSEVGLGNVDNTADANKSVKYATSAGNADTLDGNHASAFASSSHTHNYAGSSSAGGSANSSLVLTKNSSFNDASTGRVSYFDAEITNTTNNASWSAPSSGWHQIYHNDLSVANYWTELAFPVNDVNGLAWRQRRINSYYGWYRILDSNNYKSYCTPSNIGAADINCNTIGEYHSVTSNIQVKSTSTTYEVARLNIPSVFSDNAKTGTYLINLEMYLNADSQPQFSYNIDGKYSNFLCTISDIGTGNSLSHRRVTFILKSTRQDVSCEIIVKGKFTGTAGPSLYATINAIRIGNY